MASVLNSTLLNFKTGILSKDACIVIVKTEWNAPIIEALEAGVLNVLKEHGIGSIYTLTVPGAVEIPFGIRRYTMMESFPKASAIIALGCVIQGDTPHFDYVCSSVTQGITQLNLTLDIPVIFGVLTVLTEAQAWERLGGKHGHKGAEAAITALKMIQLIPEKK